MLEIEVKIRIKDRAPVLSKISEMTGAAGIQGRFEDDTHYDFQDLRLFDSGAMFRLRISYKVIIDNSDQFIIEDKSPRYTLTWKGILNIESRFKEREELEFDVEDRSALFSMLKTFGLKPVFRYQKFRVSANLADGKIFLDETPMGFFLEIEGKPDWIGKTASLLGFKSSDYINLDYYMLWRQYCTENRLPHGDMLFKDKRMTK